MPDIRFGGKLPYCKEKLETQTQFERVDRDHEQERSMYLLELSLTPGIHTIEYASQEQADQTVQQVVSLLMPFMHVGVYGIEVKKTESVFDLCNELITTDLDIIFIHSQAKNHINLSDILTIHGTTIIMDIKNSN